VKTKRSRSWITTVAISGGALAFAFFVFLPIQRSIAKLRAELHEQRDFVRGAATVDATIAELEQRKKEATKIVAAWQTYAPNEHAMATFIGTVSELAEEAGVKAGRITPRDRETLASLSRYPAEISVEGEFQNIARFLASLERRPETIWITKVDLHPIDKSTKLRCEVAFTVFTDFSGDSD